MTIESTEYSGVPLRVARPLTTPEAAVLVFHQAPGYTPQTSYWLEQLAEKGYLAVAPLLLHRQGVEVIDPGARFGGDMAAFAAFLSGDKELRADLEAALAFAESESIARSSIGVLGHSYGGRAAYLLASEYALAGAVGYYAVGVQRHAFQGNDGLPALADRTSALQTPWLGLLGEQDMLYTPGELDDWDAALSSAPVEAANVRYAGAGHAFDLDMPMGPGLPSPFNADAAQDAQRRAVEFLDVRLKSGVS
ncbi:dienelactone hydrolase family protein [Microbacterium sp.]|uniref:dienelactone hydrolase family protein n=1 Tax=Microbacterium sp. TaxID=51671 RepID=UPI003A892E2C